MESLPHSRYQPRSRPVEPPNSSTYLRWLASQGYELGPTVEIVVGDRRRGVPGYRRRAKRMGGPSR